MTSSPLTVYSNANLPAEARDELAAGVVPHRLVFSARTTMNLAAGAPDPALEGADAAFGQPDPQQVVALAGLKWVHLTSAGYTRYDRPDVREAVRRRGAAVTNSSGVFSEPCAQHALAMMLANSRQLPAAWVNQFGAKDWPQDALRTCSRILVGQSVLLLGYGAIARRLTELLAPFRMDLIGVRQSVRGDEAIDVRPVAEIDALLRHADHVVNILPDSAATNGILDARRIGLMKPGAIFYNIGRGNTVDQGALREALDGGRLAAAYLDVMSPEPLPPADPLWRTKNCFITPHTAGGFAGEFHHLVEHFLQNLKRFTSGAPLLDRVF